jgi:hypothetical protein
MSEEPKSIWRRPLTGKRKWLAWFAVFVPAILFGTICLRMTAEYNAIRREPIWVAGIIVFAGTLLLLSLIAFSRWLCCWRNFRRFLFGVACFATLIALFYAEEDWRGKRAWEHFKHGWETKGERFDLTALAPPSVPDDQNFAMTPIWVETICACMGAERGRTWYGDKVAALGHTNFINRLDMPTELPRPKLDARADTSNWQKSEKADLKAWQAYYRKAATITNFFPVTAQAQTPAEDVLLALSRYDSTIEELRRASELPYSRFPLGYADADPAAILLPHLASLKRCAITLQLRSLAELRAGQADKAFNDVQLMQRLIASIRTEPILISHLVRMAMLNIVLQPVWEALGDHRWTDAQLALLETELGKLDFLADYQSAMRGERALDVGAINYLRGARKLEWMPMNDESNLRLWHLMWLARFGPSGWFEQNKLVCCRMNFDLLVPIVNLETRVISPAAEARAAQACDKIRPTPYNWTTSVLLPALPKCSEKFAYAQSVANLARIACALERFRLAHGEYPESFDSLVPKFIPKLPHDVMGGQPLHYRRTDDGLFVLYSVGWNETDNGGEIGLTKSKSYDWKTGDWVWRLPGQ